MEVKQGETREQFVQRLLSQVMAEGHSQEESIAYLNKIYKPKEELSEIEKFIKIKKSLEKYGYTLDDSELTGIVERAKLKRWENGVRLHSSLETFYHAIKLENASSTVAPNGSDQQILVFPRGKHFIEKNNITLDFNDKFYMEIANSFNDEVLSRPFIDKNHEYKESYGQVLGYEVKEDGMYFNIRLNQEGIDLVRSGLYTSVSPSFGELTDTKGQKHENVLLTISLTNIPALMGALPVLQDQLELERQKKEGKEMELTRITKVLNLQAGSSEEVIMQAIETLNATVASLQESLAGKEKEIEEKDEQVEQMSSELEEIKSEALQTEAENVVDTAIELGQFHAAVRDIKVEAYKQNKEAVVTELSLIPKKDDSPKTLGAKTQHLTNELEAGEAEIMISLDLDPKNAEDRKNFIKDVRG